MTEKRYKLTWIPLANADPSPVPYTLKDGKLIYKLPSELPFGYLDLDGENVTGYFSPEDGEIEYTLRPWLAVKGGQDNGQGTL